VRVTISRTLGEFCQIPDYDIQVRLQFLSFNLNKEQVDIFSGILQQEHQQFNILGHTATFLKHCLSSKSFFA